MTNYIESLDLVAELKGVKHTVKSDAVFIDKTTFKYINMTRSLIDDIDRLLHKFLEFLKFVTANCVDMRKVSAMIDISHTIEFDSEFQSNFIIDLTSRYNCYKKAYAKATVGFKKEELISFSDENMAVAGKSLSKMQEDKFFGLVSKYVESSLAEVPRQIATRQAPNFRRSDGRCEGDSSNR